MNELKHEDVMKALECCMLTNEQQECRCEECPLWETSVMVCQELLAYHALALLREKDAEIERLTINMNAYGLTAKNLANDFADYQADVKMDIAAARAEAITEFAERVKEKMNSLSRMEYDFVPYFLVSKSFIDKTAEELKGATDESKLG